VSALSGTSQSPDTFCPPNRHAVSVELLLNASLASIKTFSCFDSSTFTCECEEAGPSNGVRHSAVKPSNRPLFVSSSLLSHLNEYFLAIHFLSSAVVHCEFSVVDVVELHKSCALSLALSITEKLGHLDIKLLRSEESRERRVGCVLIEVADVHGAGLATASLRPVVVESLSGVLLLVEAALTSSSSSGRGRGTSSLEASIVVVSRSRVVREALRGVESAAGVCCSIVTAKASTVTSVSSASATVGEATTSVSTATSELRRTSRSSSATRDHATIVVVVVAVAVATRVEVSLRRGFVSTPAR